MAETRTDFEKWLASFPEEKLAATLREYEQLAAEYTGRADETRSLIALRRRLLAAAGTPAPKDPSAENEQLFKTAPVRRTSLADAMLQVVTDSDVDVDAHKILEFLTDRGWAPGGRTPINSIHATGSRLVKDGRLRRTPNGYRPVKSVGG